MVFMNILMISSRNSHKSYYIEVSLQYPLKQNKSKWIVTHLLFIYIHYSVGLLLLRLRQLYVHLHELRNVVPSSIAIGEISSTVISMLSPGITISTPSGRLHNTSYVRCTEVELWTIVCEEWSMTSTFFFG